MNIAVIGGGKFCESLSHGLAIAGHEIFIGLKEEYGDISDSLEQFKNIRVGSIEDAAYAADIIIIATEVRHIREVAYWLDDVRKKVIVDATDFISWLPVEDINAISAIKAITGSPHVAKFFNNAHQRDILDGLFKEKVMGMLVVSDSRKAIEVVKILAKDMVSVINAAT